MFQQRDAFEGAQGEALPYPAQHCLQQCSARDHQHAEQLRDRSLPSTSGQQYHRTSHLAALSRRTECRAADLAREAR